MYLVESIESINSQLTRHFGCKFDKPEWRVVFNNDMIEKRFVTHTRDGAFELPRPQLMEVKKYPHIEPDRYILEREVPVTGETDLITKTSYEPLYVFQDKYGKYLPPKFEVCKFIIDRIHEQMNRPKGFKRYSDDNGGDKEAMRKKLEAMREYLFGNETDVGDALSYGYGVAGFHPKKELIQ